MNLFEGKSPEERNKLIAAIVFGALALIAITWGIILPMFSTGKSSRKAGNSPTPTATKVATTGSPANNAPVAPLPNQPDIDFAYTTTPVVYNVGGFNASPPGRNIFAFYEPPKPTPFSPTPTPPPKPPSPTPTPAPPDYFVAYVTPQSVYAGSKGFRLEVNGDRFTEDAVILFNGSQLPTTFIAPQGLSAQITDNMIASAGPKQITVISPSGKFSNLATLNVQEPPKPQFQYIGMISRKRNNNDEAYFQEKGGDKDPISARLNDIIESRFRLKSISAEEVILEDVNLGFRHRLALYRPEPGQGSSSFNGGGNRRGSGRDNIVPYNPNNQGGDNSSQPQPIPGIPSNIPRYRPTPRPTPQPTQKPDPGQKTDEDIEPT